MSNWSQDVMRGWLFSVKDVREKVTKYNEDTGEPYTIHAITRREIVIDNATVATIHVECEDWCDKYGWDDDDTHPIARILHNGGSIISLGNDLGGVIGVKLSDRRIRREPRIVELDDQWNSSALVKIPYLLAIHTSPKLYLVCHWG